MGSMKVHGGAWGSSTKTDEPGARISTQVPAREDTWEIRARHTGETWERHGEHGEGDTQETHGRYTGL